MSISRNIIDSGPSFSRKEVKTVAVVIAGVAPPESFLGKDKSGVFGLISQEPEREGQILVHRDGSSLEVVIYVVVNPSGTLFWAPVSQYGEITDPRTGEPKDPLYDLYGWK